MIGYTNLEQSQALSKILPLSSADMHYAKDYDGSWFASIGEYSSVKLPSYILKCHVDEHILPCWSLEALLKAMPPIQELCASTDHYYRVFCMNLFSEWHETALDACVSMIIRLNEKQLI